MAIQIGDLVQVTWHDHFRYQGKLPKLMKVRSWGRVDEITKEGIALLQNEVVDSTHVVERVMDGQFILQSTITDIKILEKSGGDNHD